MNRFNPVLFIKNDEIIFWQSEIISREKNESSRRKAPGGNLSK